MILNFQDSVKEKEYSSPSTKTPLNTPELKVTATKLEDGPAALIQSAFRGFKVRKSINLQAIAREIISLINSLEKENLLDDKFRDIRHAIRCFYLVDLDVYNKDDTDTLKGLVTSKSISNPDEPSKNIGIDFVHPLYLLNIRNLEKFKEIIELLHSNLKKDTKKDTKLNSLPFYTKKTQALTLITALKNMGNKIKDSRSKTYALLWKLLTTNKTTV